MVIRPGIRRVFKALVINPISTDRAQIYNPGYLVIRNGCIEQLSGNDPSSEWSSREFHDYSGLAILPGFVDTHVHLPQFPIMGIADGQLLEWLNQYTYPEETRFSNSEYASVVSELFFDALLANGTTCACIYASIHEQATNIAFEVAKRKGLRAFIGKTMMDRESPVNLMESTEDSIHASLRLFEKWDGAEGGRLRYVFTPRFAKSCSFQLMSRVGELARERQAFIQTHLSENREEVGQVRSLFPDCKSYTDVYAEAGLLSDRTVMAHCIHVDDNEIALLVQSATRVAFCPYSNRVLQSGVMPFSRLTQAGLTVGLGTDVAGGPSLSMFRQMGEALNSANVEGPVLNPAGALYLATMGGAHALGLPDRIGNFAPGKDADFLVVDYLRADPLAGSGAYNSPEHILSRLCYNSDAHCVAGVYVRGEKVHRTTAHGQQIVLE
jgi:guanine deaminase